MDRLAAMRTFVRVVDTGSFSGAAKHLNIGQPTVSKSIAQLERWPGVRLLVRSAHGLRPTEAGQSFCERARRALDEADEAECAARRAGQGLSGRLRVSAGVTFGSLHVVPRLPLFLAMHPNLSIDLILDDRAIDLIKEGIDIGLRIGPIRDFSQTGFWLPSKGKTYPLTAVTEVNGSRDPHLAGAHSRADRRWCQAA